MKHPMRYLLGVLFATFAAILFAGCSGDKREKTLVVGMDPSSPPFESLDKEGKLVGVSVELAEALAAELGLKLKIEMMEFDDLRPALKDRRVDVVISSMTITPERAKEVDFSEPYVKTGLALLVNKHAEVKGVADLNAKGRIVVVRRGMSSDDKALHEEIFPGATISHADEDVDCVTQVITGEADAFLYDQTALCIYYEQTKAVTQLLLKPVKAENWGIAVRKGNTELLGKVNAFLRKFTAAKGFDHLANPDIQEVRKRFAEQGVPFVF